MGLLHKKYMNPNDRKPNLAEILYNCDVRFREKDNYEVYWNLESIIRSINTTDNRAEWNVFGPSKNYYNTLDQVDHWCEAVMEDYSNSEDATHTHIYKNTDSLTADALREDFEEYITSEYQITLSFSGLRSKNRGEGRYPFSYSVIDSGCGQSPEDFKEQFLNIFESGEEKQGLAFASGENGRGLYASIPLSHSECKFIASTTESSDKVVYTLVRKKPDEGRLEYLTINGEIPTVDEFYTGEEYIDRGTVVKTYNINTDTIPDNATSKKTKRQILQEYPDPIVPLNLRDTRGSGDTIEETSNGMIKKADKHPAFENLVKKQSVSLEEFKDVEMTVFVTKRDSEIESLDEKGLLVANGHTSWDKEFFDPMDDTRMFLTVGGQTHESYTYRQLGTEELPLENIGEDILLVVDCTKIRQGDENKIFRADRSGSVETEETEDLLEEINNELTNIDGLQAADEIRGEAQPVTDISAEDVKCDGDTYETNVTIEGPKKAWNKEYAEVEMIENDSDEWYITDRTNFSFTVHLPAPDTYPSTNGIRITDYRTNETSLDTFSVEETQDAPETIKKASNEQETKTDIDTHDPNMLQAICSFTRTQSVGSNNPSLIRNRMNSQGEKLEEYMKDLYTGVPITDDLDTDDVRENNLAWGGNKNSTPDFIATESDAVEVKKIEKFGDLQLNSSYPHRKLSGSDPKVSDGVPIDADEIMDMVYAIGVVDNNKINNLCLIDGECFAAEAELYRKVEEVASESLKNNEILQKLGGLVTEETNEPGRVKDVGQHILSTFRLRGMWSSGHPLDYYEELTGTELKEKSLVSILPKQKYDNYDDTQRDSMESLEEVEVDQVESPICNDTVIITIE